MVARSPPIELTPRAMSPPWLRAMSRAIDRQQYVDIVYSGDAQANGLVPWTMGKYALDADELRTTYQPYDVQDAKALISAVGGLKFNVIYPDRKYHGKQPKQKQVCHSLFDTAAPRHLGLYDIPGIRHNGLEQLLHYDRRHRYSADVRLLFL